MSHKLFVFFIIFDISFFYLLIFFTMDYAAIKEARELLGEEFDWIPDVSMDLMVKCFERIAYLLVHEADYKSDE